MAESISVAPEGQQQPQLQGIFAGGQQPPLVAWEPVNRYWRFAGLGTGTQPALGVFWNPQPKPEDPGKSKFKGPSGKRKGIWHTGVIDLEKKDSSSNH